MDADRFENHRDNFLEIVGQAQNLQEVQNRLSLNCIERIPVEKMHILKNVMLPRVDQWEEKGKMRLLWENFLESEPKLHVLSLHRFVPFGNFTKHR